MNQYFISNAQLKKELRYIDYQFKGERFKFAAHSGIFSKDHVDFATDILLNTIPPLSGSVLDLGCGYGVIGIVLSKAYGIKLTQADVNLSAVELTKLNCKYNEVESDVIESDCFAGINGKFDVIVINPPIHAGKSVTYKMYEQSLAHLNSGGTLYVVTFKKHGAQSTLTKLREVYANRTEVLYKKKGICVFSCSSNSNSSSTH